MSERIMSTKSQVENYLNELDATFEVFKDPLYRTWSANLDAPHGAVWTQTHTHCVCINDAPDKATLWKWMWAEVNGEGVVECDQRPNCDICDPE